MKLFLLGSTGKAGRAILREALERGHFVTAYVRTPSKIAQPHPHLTLIQGDAIDTDRLAKYMAGHDAVLSSLDAQTLKRPSEGRYGDALAQRGSFPEGGGRA
jgi:putative NADH-flavin reductase